MKASQASIGPPGQGVSILDASGKLIAPPGQAELSKIAMTKSMKNEGQLGFQPVSVYEGVAGKHRPSWPGGLAATKEDFAKPP
jgi:hypothetical protein